MFQICMNMGSYEKMSDESITAKKDLSKIKYDIRDMALES